MKYYKICIFRYVIILFCIFISFVFTFKLFAQTFNYDILCTYSLEYQPNSTDVKSRKTEEMLLLLNDRNSIFKSKNCYLSDSIFSNSSIDLSVFTYLNSIPTNFRYSIEKDSSNSILYVDFIGNDRFEYIETRNKFDWKLLSDTATINGFLCQKATTYSFGRKWDAWFALDISVNDGPYKFGGLPGLIIMVSDSMNQYTFILTSMERRVGKVLVIAKKITRVDKGIFYSSLDYYKKNEFEMILLRGVKFSNGVDKFRKRISDRNLADNNPIELDTIFK